MPASRLQHITKIGVEETGPLADRLDDPEILRLESLDTDLRPPASAPERTLWIVFSNEPAEQLRGLGGRFHEALGEPPASGRAAPRRPGAARHLT